MKRKADKEYFNKKDFDENEIIQLSFKEICKKIENDIGEGNAFKIPVLSFYEECFLRLYFALQQDKSHTQEKIINPFLTKKIKDKFTIDDVVRICYNVVEGIRNIDKSLGFMGDFKYNKAAFAFVLPPKNKEFTELQELKRYEKFNESKGKYLFIFSNKIGIVFVNAKLISQAKVNKAIILDAKDFKKVVNI